MIDIVHDIAGSYRELLQANSYPGQLGNFKKYIKNNSFETPFYEATLLFVYMLLDSEVTFCAVGEGAIEAQEYIAKLTYAKNAPPEDADYIFILSCATDGEILDAIKCSKAGTLVDPHKSATIICEAKSVTEGKTMHIAGPGIKDTAEIMVDYAQGWGAGARQEKRRIPLGHRDVFCR